MTLHPIRFLENVSNDSGIEMKRRKSPKKKDNIKTFRQNVLPSYSPVFGIVIGSSLSKFFIIGSYIGQLLYF